jgi:hypothetical protein
MLGQINNNDLFIIIYIDLFGKLDELKMQGQKMDDSTVDDELDVKVNEEMVLLDAKKYLQDEQNNKTGQSRRTKEHDKVLINYFKTVLQEEEEDYFQTM